MVIYMKLLQLICPVPPTTRVAINTVTTTITVQNENESDTGTENSSTSHLHERRSNRVSLSLGNLHCFFCTESDAEENPIAAGSHQASQEKVNTLQMVELGAVS